MKTNKEKTFYFHGDTIVCLEELIKCLKVINSENTIHDYDIMITNFDSLNRPNHLFDGTEPDSMFVSQKIAEFYRTLTDCRIHNGINFIFLDIYNLTNICFEKPNSKHNIESTYTMYFNTTEITWIDHTGKLTIYPIDENFYDLR